ncbi:restriction endonuclease subunit S [Plesiomonas shigelloides]|uniref:restriction endonuclease subunit S n=1 Tax=Plesiomonas shigelloides TaxID=703 RepID=UPI00351D67B1
MKLVEIGKLCKLQNGKAFKPTEWSDKGLPIVRIQNLNNEEKPFNYCDFDVDKKFHIDSGDLLFSWSGTPGTSFGAFFWHRGPAILNQHIFNVLIDESLVRKDYFRLAMNAKLDEIIAQAHGGVGLQHITKGKLEAVKIPLPPLETQKQIAEVLEKADQLRKDCLQMEQELNSLAQSVFIEMFGDPVKNPKGWDKKELLSLCSKVTDGTHQSPEWAETGVPFLFISNVRNGKVDFDSGKYITRSCYEELTRTSPIEVDDILYTTVGSYGHVALVKDNFPDFCFQRHIAHIKPDPNKVIPEFLFYQLQTSGVKHLADLAVKGIAQKTLNLKDLKKFEMIVPPEEKQLELINYMVHQYQALNELEQMKSDYEMLFSSLMQKAFKGELDL